MFLFMVVFSYMTDYIHIPGSIIEETKNTLPQQGKRSLEPLRSFAKEHGVPLAILEDTDVENEAEVHKTKADLWQCIGGEAVFIIGGELVEPYTKGDPNELFAKSIVGGKEQIVRAGDWLWIPASVPHAHRAQGTARFFVIKVPIG